MTLKMNHKDGKSINSSKAIFPCILMCWWAFYIFIESVDSQVTWKIVASAMGFLGFLFLTIMFFVQFLKKGKGQ